MQSSRILGGLSLICLGIGLLLLSHDAPVRTPVTEVVPAILPSRTPAAVTMEGLHEATPNRAPLPSGQEVLDHLEGRNPELFRGTSLELEDAGESYRILPDPDSAGPEAIGGSIPKQYEQGWNVTWRGHAMKVKPMTGVGATGKRSEGAVIFPLDGAESLLVPMRDKIEELIVVRDPDSLPAMRYLVEPDPSVKEAKQTENGSVEFWSEEAPYLRLDPIVAVDAAKRVFHGSWEVGPSGSAWVADVKLDLQGARYPVVIDPGWSTTMSIVGGIDDFSLTLLSDGKVLMTGGWFNNIIGDTFMIQLNDSSVYDPATKTFRGSTKMATVRARHSAVLLPDGKVLVAGGARIPLTELYDPVTGTWSPAGSLSHPRYERQTLTLLRDGRTLLAGGNPVNGDPTAGCELFDPATKSWSPTGSMFSPRAGHTATLLRDGRVLVVGGALPYPGHWDDVPVATAEIYDPGTGQWSPAGAMRTRRAGHSSTLLADGTVLVAGGGTKLRRWPDMFFEEVGTQECEIFDPPAMTWRPTGTMKYPRIFHNTVLLPSGNVLLIRGAIENVGSAYAGNRSCEMYIASTGRWMAADSLPNKPWYSASLMLPSGNVLTVGPEEYKYKTMSTYFYEHGPIEASWVPAADLPGKRVGGTATLLPDGSILVAGGTETGKTIRTCLLYRPDLQAWSSTGSMSEERDQHTATLLSNGKVLVAGGSGRQGIHATAELYDPATGSWSAAAGMAFRRRNHTATLLGNGEVLLAGGLESSKSKVRSCEKYDAVSNTWKTVADLIHPRIHHTATLMSNGKILMAGGSAGNRCEEIDPVSGRSEATVPLPESIYGHTATPLPDGRVLLVGGRTAKGVTRRCQAYSPSMRVWSAFADLPEPKY